MSINQVLLIIGIIFPLVIILKLNKIIGHTFLIVNLPIISGLYVGGVVLLGVAPETVETTTILIIIIMTWLPQTMSLIIIKSFRTQFCTINQLCNKESSIIISKLKKINNTLVLMYSVLLIYIVFFNMKEGFFFRELYARSVADSSTTSLIVCQSLGVMLAISSFASRKYTLWIVTTFSLIILGKKLPFLTAFLFPFLAAVFYGKMSYKNLIFPACISIIGLWIISSYVYYESNDSLFVQLASTFDYISNFNYFLNNFNLGSTNGEIMISSIIKLIPRVLWESKPQIYGFLLIHEQLFPTELAIGFTPSTFETFSVWLADFGYTGIIFYSFFSATWFCLILYKKLPIFLRLIFLIYSLDQTIGMVIGIIYSISKLNISKLRAIQ